ncbi:MAG TPA: CoA transferase, partial [Roseiarcus sp.]|nr:CoA transferase [Roseiarcus sp.]
RDPGLQTMSDLAAARPRIHERVSRLFSALSKAELMARCERLGLPFAPIARPSDLFDDPHLKASAGLLPIDVTRARSEWKTPPSRPTADLPAPPISLPGGRPGLARQPPRIGEHSLEVAREAGLPEEDLRELISSGAIFSSC